MAITATAAQNSILMLNVAMFGQAAGTTVMAAALPTFVDGNTYAQTLVTTSDAYKILSPEQAFTKVINNLSAGTGVTAADVEALAKGMVPFVDAGLSVGATINLLTAFLYQNQSLDNVWKNSAVQLLNKTTAAAYYTLDQNQPTASTSAIANVTYRTGTDATSVSFQLTTAAETFVGGAGNDTFYAVAGNAVGQQDQSTLNSGDSMVGGLGDDIMYVNMLNNYTGGAMIHGIETLRLGTPGIVTFDYNVNEGQPQVADVTKLVADQINVGESLTINNIIKTNSTLPTLSWENDAITAQAGTFAANYRAAQVSGTTDSQTVVLKNVNNGVLNIGAGIETITISGATGSSRDTLANSGNTDGVAAPHSNAADLVSSGSLTKVEMTGAVELGKAANVVSSTTSGSYGLTDRAVATDLGLTAGTTASNLLSVESRVTEVDANTMTANANVKFTPRTDVATGGSMNVKFTGGTGNDYVEFQLGNSTVAGGAGNDTFAYVNGQTNSSFGANDVITGGTGTDTVQLGLNGAGTYTLSVTEFHQVTGVDVLDLRANADNVAIYSGMVAAADAATFIVRTDKIVQQSDTDSSNNQVATVNNGLEKNSTHTVYLNQLNNNQAIQFIGGSGSDRLVLNDATFSSAANLDGGVKDQVVNGAASNYLNTQYDTLTVVDNAAVIDNQDLSNIKNFQGIIFSKPQTGAIASETLILTDAFLQANTMASNVAYTNINDTIFQIGTAGAGAGAALAAGDTVTIDYTYLTNASAGRNIDVQSLTNAGVTIVWKANGVTTAQPTWVTADAAFQSVINSGAAVAVRPTATVNLVAGGTYTGTAGTDTTFTGTIASLVGTTITGGGATSADSLVVTDAGAVVVPATVTVIDTITLANGVNTLTGAVATGATAINGGTGADTLVLAAADNISGITLSSIENIQTNGAATMSLAQHNAATIIGNNAADHITLTTAGTLTGVATVESYTLANGTNNFTVTTGNTGSVNGGTGADTVGATVTQLNLMTGGVLLGTGTDVLNITGGMTAAMSTAALTAGGAVTGTETINISGASTANALTVTDASGVTTLNASGVTGGGISVVTTGLTGTNGNTTVTLTSGNDTLAALVHNDTSVAATNNMTFNLGTGNATIANFTQTAGTGTIKFAATATAGSTTRVDFTLTTSDLEATTKTVLNFGGAVTGIKAIGGSNVAGQIILYSDDLATQVANGTACQTILWDADGNGAFTAGDIVFGGGAAGATIQLVGASAMSVVAGELVI